MASIGDLVVNLGLNSKKFTSGLASAGSGLKSLASSAVSLFNPITAGFAAVTAGAVSAGAAVYVFAGRIAGLADIADKATQTGLSGAFLQRLGYAADQSGVSVETLQKSVQKLTVMIGKGDAKPFAKMGVDLKYLQGLNPEAQFRKIAESISKLPTAADRAAAAVRVFGKSGIEMTGLFAGGMNDLNALLADAAALGIGVSDEGLARAAAADDAIQKMKASFGAMMDHVTVGLAPTFEAVAGYITQWVPPLTEFIGKFNGLSDKAKFLGDAFQAGMDVGIETIKEHWNQMLDDMVKASLASALQIADNMNPKTILKNLSIVTGIGQPKPTGNPQATPLQNAKDRFSSVMEKLNSAPSTVASNSDGQSTQPKIKDDGSKLKTLFGGFAESAAGMFEQAKLAGQSKLTDLGIKGNYLGSIVKSMFTNDRPKTETETIVDQNDRAGAANKGSREALRIAMRGALNSYEKRALKLQERANELAEKQLKATNSTPQLVADF